MQNRGMTLIQVSESNISYQGNIDDQALAPRPLGHGITFADRRDTLLKVYMTDFFKFALLNFPNVLISVAKKFFP